MAKRKRISPAGPPAKTEAPRLSDEDAALLDRIANEVVRRRLTTPAILLLESVKPLNFVGSQFLVFMDPIVRLFLTIRDYDRFVQMLEQRDSIEWLIQAIERREDEG